ncbi:hypothetical protein ACFLYR_05750 [Chloroflexota bacterium]
MNAFKTCNEIRRALDSDYRHLVDTSDIKKRERFNTQSLARNLQPQHCASCGRKPPDVLRLEVAHISPLSECAITNEDNLLLLCKERPDNSQPGCHGLYDWGYCSIEKMFECRKQWVGGRQSTIRNDMLQLRASFGQSHQQQGHLKKELSNLRNQQASTTADSEAWNSLQIQISELTRRRARKGALERAHTEIIKINPENLHRESVKARYFYEKAYIELLSGRLPSAFQNFYAGRQVLEIDLANPKNLWRWAAHTALLSQLSCIMRASKS